MSLKHEGDKVIVFERGNLLWIFNFNATQSFVGYRVGTCWAGKHRLRLSSDDKVFGGHGRVEKGEYFTTNEEWCGRPNWIQVYLPARCCVVLEHE